MSEKYLYCEKNQTAFELGNHRSNDFLNILNSLPENIQKRVTEWMSDFETTLLNEDVFFEDYWEKNENIKITGSIFERKANK